MSDEPKTYETTPEHFALFKSEAKRFIDLFGLKDWQIHFEHSYREDALASCDHNTGSGKVSTLVLSTSWGVDEPNDKTISQTAFHEVCHILLADSYDAACCIDLSSGQRYFHVDRAHHAVIRRLENVVLPRL